MSLPDTAAPGDVVWVRLVPRGEDCVGILLLREPPSSWHVVVFPERREPPKSWHVVVSALSDVRVVEDYWLRPWP